MIRKSHLMLSALACLVVGTAAAQSFPSRPITIVVPYPAGGTSDGQVRMIQEKLSKLLGQPIVVENKAGASGAIGTQFVARAKADGYTLLYPNTGFLITPLLNDNAGYDPLNDFKPVTQVTSVPMVLVTNKSVPGSNLRDFLQYARSLPNGIMYATAGTTSYGHIASARLMQMAGIKGTAVPYRGEAPSTAAVRSGEVQMLLTSPSSAMLGHVEQGSINMLGVATEKPTNLLPGIPTINSEVPGYTAGIWFGLVAPAGTPDDVVKKIETAVKTALEDKEIRAKLVQTGAEPKASTSAEFARALKDEMEQLREIITKFDIKAE